jgi:hypothetical protein
LVPRDLLRAAQTCRYWRILCEDNLLWREKCKEGGVQGEGGGQMFFALRNNASFIYSPHKVSFHLYKVLSPPAFLKSERFTTSATLKHLYFVFSNSFSLDQLHAPAQHRDELARSSHPISQGAQGSRRARHHLPTVQRQQDRLWVGRQHAKGERTAQF